MTVETNDLDIQYINPEELHGNPAFSQAVSVSGRHKTIYIGGQNAVNMQGEIVGKGDIVLQSEQVLANLKAVLKSCKATFDNVIKWTVYIVHGNASQVAFGVFQAEMRTMKNPPIISVMYVSALAHPDFLLEVEAVVVVPES